MARKFFVGGNWKLNGSNAFNKEHVDTMNAGEHPADIDVVVAPPALYVASVRSSLRKDWGVAGQNCYIKEKGAFTGENSVVMLKDVGAEWIILGHSERRAIFNESEDLIGKKCGFALEQGMKIIPCIGEQLSDREAGKTMDVCIAQLKPICDNIKDWTNVVIAYEPVWAIGTGVTATPEQAQETHRQIRKWLADSVSKEVAEKTRIIYGGSVSAANCVDLGKREDIDGFLVGGASLKPDFIKICNARA